MVDLWIGGHAWSVDGERAVITGPRMFSPLYGPPPGDAVSAAVTMGAIDSGAFSDPPERRLTPASALERQLAWEERARRNWNAPDWQASYVVSYDLLVDEKWTDGRRSKSRWSETDAEYAVDVTVDAAHWLAANRERYTPRTPILALQGVTAEQFVSCLERVLPCVEPSDVIGYGGFCILGRWTSWLPEFGRTLRLTLPLVAASGVRHIHIFGVLFLPALGVLLYEADRHGLTASTDSSAPVRQCIGSNPVKAGRRRETLDQNIAYWQETLAMLRDSPHYRAHAEQLRLGVWR